MARLAPNGLIRQTDEVDVSCLKPSLVRVLKTIESHYGRKLIVTSGYRSPERNRRARGAKNSLPQPVANHRDYLARRPSDRLVTCHSLFLVGSASHSSAIRLPPRSGFDPVKMAR